MPILGHTAEFGAETTEDQRAAGPPFGMIFRNYGSIELVQQTGNRMDHNAPAGWIEILHDIANHWDQAVGLAGPCDDQYFVRTGFEHFANFANLFALIGDNRQTIELVDEVFTLFQR